MGDKPTFGTHPRRDESGLLTTSELPIESSSAGLKQAYTEGKVTDYSNTVRGIVPKVVHKDDPDDIALVELIEKLPGEVPFDAYVKALMSTPEVAEQISELESCLQRLASAVRASGLIDECPGLRATTEEAAIVLKKSARSGRRSESNQGASECATSTIPRRLAAHQTLAYEQFGHLIPTAALMVGRKITLIGPV